MADIDDDRLELLERRLAERVTERVRPALFRFYAIIGTTVFAVLGFVGWDIVRNIKSEIKTEITGVIDKEIQTKRTEIAERIAETKVMAKRANETMQQVEKQLDDFQPQAENLNETIERVKALNVISKDLRAINSQELKPLVSNVESLSSQLKTLAEQVNQLNTIVTAGGLNSKGEPTQAPQQRSKAIKSVISDAKEAEQRLAQARNKTTVFLQFAGGTRELAESLSAALKAAGYVVPGEDREGGAAGKHEVRYFYEEDKVAAQRLAQDTTDALRNLIGTGRKVPDIVTASLVSYPGKKPRPGVLELWIEIPPS